MDKLCTIALRIFFADRLPRLSEEENNLFYVLTNSRGFTVEKTTKALAIKCVNVLGQIRPGVPVWQTGDESKFPQIPYVIFPGNVGESTTLREAVEVLSETPLS